VSPTYADGRLYIRGTIPGSNKHTPAQRIAKGLVPEHGCVYCFDLRKGAAEKAGAEKSPDTMPKQKGDE
jgi:hypothetical protein